MVDGYAETPLHPDAWPCRRGLEGAVNYARQAMKADPATFLANLIEAQRDPSKSARHRQFAAGILWRIQHG